MSLEEYENYTEETANTDETGTSQEEGTQDSSGTEETGTADAGSENSQEESKPWFEGITEKQYNDREKVFNRFTQTNQELLEREKLITDREKRLEALESKLSGDDQENLEDKDIDEKLNYLLKKGDNTDSIVKKVVSELSQIESQRTKAEKFMGEIKGFIKDADSTEASNEQIFELNDLFMKEMGTPLQNLKQFKIFYNGLKNEFSNDLLGKAESDGYQRSQDDLKKGRSRVKGDLTGKGQKPDSKNFSDMKFDSEEEKIKWAIADARKKKIIK